MSPDPQFGQGEEISDKDLLRLINKPIEDILSLNIDQEADFENQWQLLRLRKCDLYIRGLQFLGLNDTAGYVDWTPVGSASTPSLGEGSSAGLFDYNIDIVDSYRKKFISTLGSRPFYNSAAIPDDPQSEVDRKAARQANLCAMWMRSKWNLRLRNIEIFDRMYRAGAVIIYDPFIADKEMFGEIKEPIYSTRMVEQPVPPDPLTGLPRPPQQVPIVEQSGEKKYAGSGPGFQIWDGNTVTLPFSCTDFKKTPWLRQEEEINRGILLQLHGDVLRDKLNPQGEIASSTDSVSQEQGKMTRASEASLTGMYRAGTESLWTRSRYWLSTAMYEFLRDEDKRKIVYQKFPDGLKITRVEGITVKMENEAVTDVLGIIQPYPSNTVYQDPVCWSILGNQDIVNFIMNIAIAKEERGLPSAIADAELIDTDALASKPYLPKEIIPAKASFGGSLREAIVPLPTPNKDDGAADVLLSRIESNTQTTLGLLPPVWGGGSQQETVGGRRMEINQGLMQLGVPGEAASWGYAEAYQRGCALIAKYAPQGFAIPVPDDPQGLTSEMLDLEALRAGKYHFEPDASMPSTRGELVEDINGILKENPDLAMAMGLHAPLAATALREFLLPGLPDIPSELSDIRDKVVERIQLLLQQQPVPGPPDPMTGQPGPMMPSIMPEEFVDDPAQHAELTREWLNTGAGRKASSDPKRAAGYQNVVAYGLFCQNKSIPPPPPPPPPKPPTLAISAKAVDLVDPAVSQILQQDFGLGAVPPGPQPPNPQNMPQGGPPPPNQGKQPMAPNASNNMPLAMPGPTIQ